MSKPKPHQRFVDADTYRFEVVIEDDALRAIEQACSAAHSRETGGILIGRLAADGRTAFVCEATAKPLDSSAGWTWFMRGSRGLKALLDSRWKNGQHYLGEWHFHPNAGCTPSAPDMRAMWAIAANERYACKEPVLLILGGRVPDAYQLSASVFPHRESPVFLAGRPRSHIL